MSLFKKIYKLGYNLIKNYYKYIFGKDFDNLKIFYGL